MTQAAGRVAHVTFDMGIGGTEQVICQLVRGTPGFQHTVVCIDGGPGAMGRALSEEGFAVHALNRRPGLDLGLVSDLRRLIRQQRIEIVHCHQYTPFVYGVLSTLGRSVRVIFTEHGRFYPDRSSWKRRLVNPVMVMKTDAITAISAATARALEQFEGIPLSKTQVIYNGIDQDSAGDFDRATLLAELGLPGQASVVGTVGRLDTIKNFPMMIRAFARLANAHPDLHLVIIGDGPERANLEALVRSCGLDDRIRLTGFIDSPRRYLDVFAVFLLSSFSEGTSMSLLESMVAGRPAVVTRVGGNAELVENGRTGLVVESEDETSFSEAIDRLLVQPATAEQYGTAARCRYLETFTVEHMTREYARLYSLLQERGSRMR